MKYIVECFNDEALLLAFGIDSFEINHQYSQGKSGVLNLLSKQKNKFGMIDFDTSIVNDYFDKFVEIIKLSENIIIYQEKNNNNSLVVFSKKIETMFVNEVLSNNAEDTAQKLGFNNSEGNYHKVGSDKEKLKKLKNLLETVIQRSIALQALKQYF